MPVTKRGLQVGATVLLTASLLVEAVGAQGARAADPAPHAMPAALGAAVLDWRPSQPITESARRAAALETLARVAGQSASGHGPANECPRRMIVGAVLGAGAGFGIGYGWLAKAGGSDSAGTFLRTFTALGLGLGLLGGLVACSA